MPDLPEASPVNALSSYNPTAEELTMLAKIRERESSNRYNILHGTGYKEEGTVGDLSKFPQWQGFQGPAGVSHAAGAYGFQPGTYADMVKLTGRSDFTPEAQDINALALLRKYGPYATQSWAASMGQRMQPGGKARLPGLPVESSISNLPEGFRPISQPPSTATETSGIPTPPMEEVPLPEAKPGLASLLGVLGMSLAGAKFIPVDYDPYKVMPPRTASGEPLKRSFLAPLYTTKVGSGVEG